MAPKRAVSLLYFRYPLLAQLKLKTLHPLGPFSFHPLMNLKPLKPSLK